MACHGIASQRLSAFKNKSDGNTANVPKPVRLDIIYIFLGFPHSIIKNNNKVNLYLTSAIFQNIDAGRKKTKHKSIGPP